MSEAQILVEPDLDAEEIEEVEEEVYVPAFFTDEELRALFTDEAITERGDVSLAECQCITKDPIGVKVTQTQFNGKILTKPIHLGVFGSSYAATDFLQEHRNDGSYAIREIVYECGHTNIEWRDFWNIPPGSRT